MSCPSSREIVSFIEEHALLLFVIVVYAFVWMSEFSGVFPRTTMDILHSASLVATLAFVFYYLICILTGRVDRNKTHVAKGK